MSEVRVVDYDTSWPVVFEVIRNAVWKGVQEIAIAIEHVGSTAVPGLAAKPVIDVDVIVPDGHVTVGIERLIALGYVHCGNQGISQREVFKGLPELPRHHMYLCSASSPALWNHLTVRDYLRANPDAAIEYGQLKKQLARIHVGDMDGYVAGKTAFLTSILMKAGMTDRRVAEIEFQNRKR